MVGEITHLDVAFNGLTTDEITSTIQEQACLLYSEKSPSTTHIRMSQQDLELRSILNQTKKLTQNVTPEILTRIDELIKNGANYDYVFSDDKPLYKFMLEQEILSRIPNETLSFKHPFVNIFLSYEDVQYLQKRYRVKTDEILEAIHVFSGIYVKNASIRLYNGQRARIDENGTVEIQKKPYRPQRPSFAPPQEH